MHDIQRSAALLAAAVVGLFGGAACSSNAGPPVTGTVALRLDVAPGVAIHTVSWTIHQPALLPGDRSGTVDVAASSGVAFTVGGLRAGSGYVVSLRATTEGVATLDCVGSSSFDVAADATTPVSVAVQCGDSVAADGGATGSVVVGGTTTFPPPSCAEITALSASPSEVDVGASLSLSAKGEDDRGSAADAAFSWTVSGGSGAGTFSDPNAGAPAFTCTAAGKVTVTVTVASADAACTKSSASVELTCDGKRATAISAGFTHSCALLSNGTVECWGSNVVGQLGDGTDATNFSPVPVSNLTDAIAVAAGDQHTCALRAGGTVVCWGAENQVGSGVADGPDDCGGVSCSKTPVPVAGLAGVTAIAAGSTHTCALLSDTTVACWGVGSSGQLGNPAGVPDGSLAPLPVQGVTGAKAIAAGDTHSCALLADGSASCWGYNGSGTLGIGTTTGPEKCGTFPCATTPQAVHALTEAVAIVAGGDHTCALLEDGSASCWGLNDVGELGNPAPINSAVPVPVRGLAGAASLAAGFFHTCAVLADGSARCWGDDANGEMCIGTVATQVSSPTPVPAWTAVTALSAGSQDSCALLANGAVQCCGFNVLGELGDGTMNSSATPVDVGL